MIAMEHNGTPGVGDTWSGTLVLLTLHYICAEVCNAGVRLECPPRCVRVQSKSGLGVGLAVHGEYNGGKIGMV